MTPFDIEALAARIEALEDKVSFLLNHEPAPYTPRSRDEKAANEAAVVALLKKGNTKDALKLYREVHEMPYPELQQAIEQLKKKHGL